MQTYQLSAFERDQFPLWAFRVDTHRDWPTHSHDFTELVLIFSGHGLHVGPDGEYPFQAGDVFVIEPGVAHAYHETSCIALVNIMFSAERLRLPDHDFRQLPGYHALFHLEPRSRRRKGAENLRLDEADLSQADTLTRGLLRELEGRQPGYQSLSAALLTELIVFLSRRVEGVDNGGMSVQAIGKALSHIERHFAEPLTLDDLARQAGMSVRNFQRRFREAVGVTPFQRLQEVRIGRAKPLLRSPEQTVSEIAFLVGFQDSNYFSRQFRNLEGVSPGQYRALGMKQVNK